MTWVLLHESGLTYEFQPLGVSGALPALTDSTVTYERGDGEPESASSWDILFTTPIAGPIRVTPSSYLAGTGEQGNIYTPGYLLVGDNDTIDSQVDNAAPPFPDEFYPDGAGVEDWLPSPTELELAAPIALLAYRATQSRGEAIQDDDAYSFLIEVWQDDPPADCNYNCECDDEYPTRTLAQMREFLMIRLGWAAMKDTPLPGVNDTLNSFLQDAQDQLHAEYRIPRMERFFTWDMTAGTKFYDLPENSDECTKQLDPRQVTWVGISDGCDAWRKLVCGIKPEYYYGDVTGMPSHYEIRQCIEVWPPPADNNWKLRVKGYFYSETLTEDTDVASMDFNAVQLFALANAKAHYGQADAANVMRQAMRYVANMVAGGHHTRRYVPGADEWVAPPLPVLTGYPGDP